MHVFDKTEIALRPKGASMIAMMTGFSYTYVYLLGSMRDMHEEGMLGDLPRRYDTSSTI